MKKAKTRWKVIGCSVAGTGHISAGIPCQDSWDCRLLDGGILVGAVADGAGSAKLACQGSSLAARGAVEYISSRLGSGNLRDAESYRLMLKDCISHIRDILEKEAQSVASGSGSTASVNDLATTLIAFCLAEPFLAVVQIGDGAMVCREGSGALAIASKPETGEYINETSFLTSADFEQHCRFAVESGVDLNALSLFSDGLQMLALVYPDQSPHGPFFNPLFDFFLQENAGAKDLLEFLSSGRVCERSDDDKTLLIAVRVPASDKC